MHKTPDIDRFAPASQEAKAPLGNQETKAPLVSIVLPMYNSAKTIACCIESIKRQTMGDFEVLLIDDGSTDDSLAVAAKNVRGDERFRIISRENHGVSLTRNFALALARGTWVAFIDADDWFAPYALEAMVDGVQQGAELAVCSFYRVGGERYSVKRQEPTCLMSYNNYVKAMSKAPANYFFACLWNKLFKRSIICEAGLEFDNTMDFAEDHVFVLRYLLHTSHVAVVDRPVYFYVDTPGSLVHNAMNLADFAESRTILADHYEAVCKKAGMSSTMSAGYVAGFVFSPATDGIVTALDEKLCEGMVPPAAAKLDSRFNYLFY